MRSTLRFIAAALVLASALVVAARRSEPQEGGGRVFYYNQFAQSEGRVTERSIEAEYDLTSLVRGRMPDILRLLAEPSPPGPDLRFNNTFVNDDVRLKIVRPNGPVVMMDLYGNVVGIGKPHYIGRATRNKLDRLLRSLLPDDLVGDPPPGRRVTEPYE